MLIFNGYDHQNTRNSNSHTSGSRSRRAARHAQLSCNCPSPTGRFFVKIAAFEAKIVNISIEVSIMNRSVLVLFLLAATCSSGLFRGHTAGQRAKAVARASCPPARNGKQGSWKLRLYTAAVPEAPVAKEPVVKEPAVKETVKEPAAKLAAPADSKVDAAASDDNPLLRELLTKGVEMPDGSLMKLSPPTLGGVMDASARKAAIEKIMPRNCSFEDFTTKDTHAPLGLNIRTFKSKKAGYTFRTIDVGFVAFGDWKTLKSEKFSESLLQRDPQAKQGDAGEASAKFGELSKDELAKRGLKGSGEGGQQDRYIYSTVAMFNLLEIKATRYGVLTESPDSLILAARIDPRFATDAEYPNQWRPIDIDAQGQKVLGEKHPYQGAAFYVKATRLSDPPGAIFFEFHSAYNEPKGWFEDEPDKLRRKLPEHGAVQGASIP